ncbi:hypothetical protein [Mycoplasma elephantis]|uniref:hypothetical protein n=1 Tax=Mycoplasma elephantis TaxID=114882 RepID=UPI00048169E8|nr:hypothetical protein [Mycoplasma elephantis]
MSFKQTIYDQLKVKINAKNILVLTGNTQDFIYPNLLDIKLKSYDELGKILNISEYLSLFLDNENYTNISYFSPFCSNPEIKKGTFLFSDENSEDKTDEFNNILQNISLNEFVDKIEEKYRAFLDNPSLLRTSKDAYILDFSDFILSEKNQETTFNQIARLIGMFTNHYNQRATYFLESKFKLVFIVKNKEIFSSLPLKNNAEVQFINIPYPDKKEREFLFSKYLTIIQKNINNFTENSEFFDSAVSITDGLSYREILQYIKVLSNIRDGSIKDFKQLFRLINFNKQESEWEKIGFEKLNSLEKKL